MATAKQNGDSPVVPSGPAILEIPRDFSITFSGAEPAIIAKSPTSKATATEGLCKSQQVCHPPLYLDYYVCNEVAHI